MKISGIRISFIGVILFVFISNVYGQPSNPCLCNRSQCGDIVASFKLVSNSTVVCDGYVFEVQNNSTIVDVSYFVWDWGDNTRDTVYTTSNQTHTYNIPDDEVCDDTQTTYQICLLAVKNCTNGYSCHNNNSPVTVVHRPVARFNFTNSVCVDRNVNFNNTSCNVDMTLPDAYLWTFHDGTTATTRNASKTYTMPGIYPVRLKVKNGCRE